VTLSAEVLGMGRAKPPRPDGVRRRTALRALLVAPLAPLALPTSARATDYASAAEVLAAVDRLEAEVALRLRALAEASPGAKAFATSVLADHERQRRARARLRKRLGLAHAEDVRAEATDLVSLEALRTAQEALVHAHAEGLPALGDSFAVDVMAAHLVELSRHLAVIDLWLEAEADRG
jgi:hypothetical protein